MGLGWKFFDGYKLTYRPYTAISAGVVLDTPLHEYTGLPDKLELCRCGYHYGRTALEALEYAPGHVVGRVEILGDVVEGDDKACTDRMRVLWVVDAEHTLRDFAAWCAEQALLAERERGREPDPRSWACIEAVRAWVRGDISDSDLAAARSAAWSAVWSAELAARSAAESAASAAEWAAESAARSAARSAVWSAEWAAVWSAEWAAWSAARSAESAARSAARSAQNEELERRLLALGPAEAAT